MISDDFVIIAFDTYGDSRNNFLLLSNAFGSQVDLRVKNASSEEDTFDEAYNAVFETKSSIVDDGYVLEFKVMNEDNFIKSNTWILNISPIPNFHNY